MPFGLSIIDSFISGLSIAHTSLDFDFGYLKAEWMPNGYLHRTLYKLMYIEMELN